MVLGPRKGKMKASKPATVVASLKDFSSGVKVDKGYKPGVDPAMDKVLEILKKDPSSLDKSGFGNRYKI